jgi:hypothetical protein
MTLKKSQCRQKFRDPDSGLVIESYLKGQGCTVTDDADDATHTVEIFNIGSGFYQLELAGTCENPLRFMAGSTSASSWENSGRIQPKRRWRDKPVRVFAYPLYASSRDSSGAQQYEIDTSVTIAEFHDRGMWMADGRVIANDELMLLCEIRP